MPQPTLRLALARALRLDEDERAHLHDLARPTPAKRRRTRPATVRRGTLQLINAMHDVPAVVLGVRNEILAWNRLVHLLLAGHLDFAAPGSASEAGLDLLRHKQDHVESGERLIVT
ncbi:hypothetical protein [Amycolatopsis acidicola]|uniref:MmyB family transcriptional regulator n=1 Tax=Amycolatopsis acidicola TaxID=2596893 RepID=UPI0014080DEA|nr:hypothetical protein [Amycolatopsis acidicola]